VTVTARVALAATLVVALAGFAGACGGDDAPRSDAGAAAPAMEEEQGAEPESIPAALRTVESAAEDTIDFALAGRRDEAVRTARALKSAADGPAGDALRAAHVPPAEVAEFRARAERVAAQAPTADLLAVALSSNRAFEMVPGFFARFESPVPADVLRLDYLDFEAKLRAQAGDREALRTAVAGLDRTWAGLRAGFVRAGGRDVAPAFDAHVARMRRLAAAPDAAAAGREAQHGLDLVDELEEVYAG
jgi:hypothetical protein